MQLPERLYKYQPVTTQTLENLRACILWFAPPVAFNDPFDCALRVMRPEPDLNRVWAHLQRNGEIAPDFAQEMRPDGRFSDEFRESTIRGIQGALEQVLKQNLHERGVACLSAKRDDLLMWAHYANGHRGFCLEFATGEEPFSQAKPVSYTDVVPQLDSVDYLELDPAMPNPIDAMMLTKNACWSYEEEWRIVHAEANTAYRYQRRQLRGLYFGAAMPERQMEMIAHLLLGAGVPLHRMRLIDGSFNVLLEPVTYTPQS